MADNRKRVLIVNGTPLNRGGTQAVIMSIVKNLSDTFCFDILLFSNEKGWYDEEFTSYGGRILRIPDYNGKMRLRQRLDLYIRWIYNSGKVKKTIRENGPYDAIHAFMAYEAGYILRCAKRCGIPMRIATSLTAFVIPENKILMRIYAHFAIRRIWKYKTCLTGCTEEACSTMFGGDKTAWGIVPNPYNDEKFDFNQYPNETKNDSPKLVQVASYSSNKNQLFTIDVFNAIVRKYPDAHLDFVGYETENGYLNRMKERISEYKLTDKVVFHPSDANVPELLSNSSYLLLPSLYEGFGIVLVEAQAMGLKCFVSSSVPKLPDCGGCIFLDLNAGAQAWAERIAEQFETDHGARSEYDTSRFSPAIIMEQYRKLYSGELKQ